MGSDALSGEGEADMGPLASLHLIGLSSRGCLDERGYNEFPDSSPLWAAEQERVQPSLLIKMGRWTVPSHWAD